MKINRTKIISAAIMLVLSVSMLAGASFAWFTVSTAPEISGLQVNLYTDIDLLVSKTGEEDSFFQSVSTESLEKPDQSNPTSIDNLPFYAGLKPISTADGIHWFLPEYTADGELEDISKFPLATNDNANVVMWNKDASGNYTSEMGKETIEYFLADNRGYYIYADVWLMTENEKGVNVTLSVPNIADGGDHNNGIMQDWELGSGDFGSQHGNKYGSYALGLVEVNNGNVLRIDNNVQTCLRVGFLVDDTFTIWEPNADQRSQFAVKPQANGEETGQYVLGYGLTQAGYSEGDYIPTNPIALIDGQKQLVSLLDSTRPANTQLLVQRKSAWNESKLLTDYANLNSSDVSAFGRFISNNNLLSATQPTAMGGLDKTLASSNMIVTLQANTPKKVRIYFWLEGQDADCWNDIASGNFLVNLEFAAQDIPTTE